jgi:hypothetical protein
VKHEVHFPRYQRDDMARKAFELYNKETTRAAGLEEVEFVLQVSNPTARNLVNRGRSLSKVE